MNTQQKTTTRIAAVITFLMLIYPPFRFPLSGDQPLKYDFFLTVFEPGRWYISIMDLTIQGALVWSVTAILLLSLRNKV
jgi:hypothetical protein